MAMAGCSEVSGTGTVCNDFEQRESLKEELFSTHSGSSDDDEFDNIIGHLQDIVLDDNFAESQRKFMDKHYHHFEDVEENKLIYTDIHREYTELIETHIETELLLRIPGFNMTKFLKMIETRRSEIPEEIFEMLLSFTDFLTFKQLFLDFKAEKEGKVPDLGGLIINSSLDTYMHND